MTGGRAPGPFLQPAARAPRDRPLGPPRPDRQSGRAAPARAGGEGGWHGVRCGRAPSPSPFPSRLPPGAAREYPRQGRAVAEEPAPLRSGRGARLLAGSLARHRNSPVIVGVAGLKGAVPGQARLLD